MSGIIWLIGKAFIFLMELILDIICLSLFLASLPAVWRWPAFCEANFHNRWEFRAVAAGNFAAVLFDIVTVVPLVITLFSWRGCSLISKISSSQSEKFYNFEARLITWQYFLLYIFTDIPTLLAFLLTHITFWRIPFLYMDVYEATCKSTSQREKYGKMAVWKNLGNGMLDIFLIPFAFILLVSVYRIPIAWRHIENETKVHYKKGVVILQSLLVLFDIPFVMMFVLTTALLFRTQLLWNEVFSLSDGKRRRQAILMHFACSLRDVFCIPFFFIVLGSMYRGVLCVKGLVDNISRWAPARPDIAITSALLELPEERGTGIILVAKGTKPAEYTIPAGTTLKLFIRNTEPFWREVGLRFGDAAGTVGSAMLPMNVSKYCDTSDVRVGSTECTLRFDVGSSVKCSTMRKNASKMQCDVELHVERGSHDATLFALSLNLASFAQYVDPDETGTKRQLTVVDLAAKYDQTTREGKPVSEVFWRIVMLQFALLVVDICGVVCFLLLHLMPHRAYRMYSLACAMPSKKQILKKQQVLLKYEMQLISHWNHFAEALSNLDDEIRKRLTAQGRKEGQSGGYRYREPSCRNFRRGPRYLMKHNTEDALDEFTEDAVHLGHYLDEVELAGTQCRSSGSEDGFEVFGSLRTQLLDHGFQFYLMTKRHLLSEGATKLSVGALFPASIVSRDIEASQAGSRAATNAVVDLDERQLSQQDSLQLTDSAALQRAIEASLEDQQRLAAAQARNSVVVAEEASSMRNEPTEHLEAQYSEIQLQSPPAVLAAESSGAPPPVEKAPLKPQEHVASCESVAQLVQSWTEQLNIHHKMLEDVQRRVASESDRQPWCGGREGWPGARSVIFAEIAQVGYDVAAVLCFLVVLCTVYRSWYIISSVFQARNKRKACLFGVVEVWIDLFYLLKIGIVLIGVRGIFTLPADLFFYMLEFPSFATARQVIDHHLSIVMIDFLSVISLVFAWDTLAFAAATLVFGAFSPGVLFESAFSRWEIDAKGKASLHDSLDVCRAGMVLIIASTWMFGVPCFVGYYVAERSFESAYIVFFAFLAACMVLGIMASISLRDERITSLRRGVVKYLQPSLHNVSLVCAMLLEFVWLLAIVFGTSRPDIFGDDWGSGLEKASRYVFLLFGETWTRHSIPFGVYFSIVVSIVFFIVSAAPIVCGEMLHWRRGRRIINSPAWIALMQFFGQTISLLVARNLSALLICSDATRTMELSLGEMQCWTGATRSLAVFSMILLSYYVPSFLMRNMRYDESICQSLDVVYPQLFKILINASNMTAICLCTIIYSNRTGVCVVMMVSSAWNIFWMTFYPQIFNATERAVCSVKSIAMYRLVMTVCIFASSLFMLIRLNDRSGISYWSLYATAATVGAGLIVSVGYRWWLNLQRTIEDDTVDELRHVLLDMETSLCAKRALYSCWRKKRRTWRRQVKSATRSSPLALLTCELERFTVTMFVSKTFLTARWSWLTKAASVVSPVDAHSQLTLRPDRDANRNLLEIMLCCICCRTVCRDLSSDSDLDDDDSAPSTEAEKLRVVLEVATALKNSTNSR
jgi:hypothetical protein